MTTNRYAAIVMDYNTGEVLYARNEHAQRYPASLTKIMTLYMVFEALDNGDLNLDQKLLVSQHASHQAPSCLGLKPGQTITVRNAILALVTKSANDVAATIAENLGGSEEEFCRRMTVRAHAIGMKDTEFHNASGLPNPRQRTTAYDMAKLSYIMMKHYPHHYHYFKTKEFVYHGLPLRNHNHLMQFYSGMDGIKTGYIRASGFNLVASVKRHDQRLIAVVMGGETAKARDHHMKDLLDSSFAKIKNLRYARLSKKSQTL